MISIQHIHPMIVHFPIVFILVLAAFDTVATLRGRDVATRGPVGNVSTGLAVLAALSAIAAFFFGDIALSIAEKGGFSSEVAETHERLGLASTIALSAWALVRVFLWWRNRGVRGALSALFPATAIAAAAIVTVIPGFGRSDSWGWR